ncbi:Hypothetical protein SMAX5B_017975 [Scophthalmus maximus]|uniref:Uncharacterized protein n=1 Tax=Scophthalmus maximus TaxID=52904 RepID=A0A2U9CBV0_SCOMX|nr:Hypothetical protein SMAX5B_017975 [Scophthalmus maximus]
MSTATATHPAALFATGSVASGGLLIMLSEDRGQIGDDKGGLVQLLGHEGHPAWAQHLVILPWSKSTTQSPDRPRAARARALLHSIGLV